MIRWLPLFVLASACVERIPDHGTFVGNPGATRVRAAPMTDLILTGLELSDGALVPVDCESADGPATRISGIDLHTALELPDGAWCGLTLSLSGDTVLFADGASGGTLEAPLDVARIGLQSASPVELGAQAWVLELGPPGFLSAGAVGVEAGSDVVLDPHGVPAEAAADLVSDDSALYADTDLDGEISQAERDAGPAMAVGTR